MNITPKQITIRNLVSGYRNDDVEGVTGLDGKLNIRPKYQREFVYKDKQRNAVIETVRKNFPLNIMYWAATDNGLFEVIDGQQRTISICEYVSGKFSLNFQYFHNLEQEEKDQILNYELNICICEGNARDKLDWFKTINIAGEPLTDQELRNAIYSGSWLSDAKRYFSRPGCAAYDIAGNYLSGSSIRQDYLETILDWISAGEIEQYMAEHQHKLNANELWLYFQSVFAWVKAIFPTYRKEMKGVEFGTLYNLYKDKALDPIELETKIRALLQDDDVTKKSGIYPYVITGQEKYLSVRAFTNNQKREAYERQNGICPACNEHFELDEMEGDHIKPWHEGGRTVTDNCQMLCKAHNRAKGGK